MTSRNNPAWWAKIYSWGKESSLGTNVIELGSGRSGSDIIEFSWTKSIANPGQGTLLLVPHKNIRYLNHILPNSIVELWIDAGDGKPPVCKTGFIDTIRRVRASNDIGAVSEFIRITFTDFTRVMIDQVTEYVAQLKKIEFLTKLANLLTKLSIAGSTRIKFSTSEQQDLKGGAFSAPEFLWLFVDSYLGNLITDAKFLVPGPDAGSKEQMHVLKLIDFGNFVQHPMWFPYLKIIFVDRMFGNVSSLWDLVRGYSHLLLNEIFIDTRPDSELPKLSELNVDLSTIGVQNPVSIPIYKTAYQDPELSAQYALLKEQPFPYFSKGANGDVWQPRVFLRPRPYLPWDMAKLPRHDISSEDTTNEDFGFSCQDIRNVFRVNPNFVGLQLDFVSYGEGRYSIVNPDSIVRHGMRKLTLSSDFCWSAQGAVIKNRPAAQAHTLEECGKQTETLALQHFRNEQLLNGTCTLSTIRPDLQVGNAVRYTDRRSGEDVLFYLERIDHQARYGDRSHTMLELVRGLPTKEVATEYVIETDQVSLDGSIKPLKHVRWIGLAEKLSFNPRIDFTDTVFRASPTKKK